MHTAALPVLRPSALLVLSESELALGEAPVVVLDEVGRELDPVELDPEELDPPLSYGGWSLARETEVKLKGIRTDRLPPQARFQPLRA